MYIGPPSDANVGKDKKTSRGEANTCMLREKVYAARKTLVTNREIARRWLSL